MPADALPLFRPDVLAQHLASMQWSAHATLATHLEEWASLLGTADGARLKESELLPDFLTHVFVEGLGYRPPVARGGQVHYTLSREALVAADGKYADAVLGRLGGERPEYIVAIEGKGPGTPWSAPSRGGASRPWTRAIGTPSTCPATGSSSRTCARSGSITKVRRSAPTNDSS